MSKKALTFGSTALLIVTLFILAGCPDVVDNPGIALPAVVSLATGSQGTAGANVVAGLTPSKRYLVQQVAGNKWYAVGATGAVQTSKSAIEDAISDTAFAPLTGTNITGLENGLEYKVFLYQKGSNGVPVAIADQKSHIIDISDLNSGDDIDLAKTAGGGGSVIIYTGDTNVTPLSAVSIADPTVFWGNTAKKYTLDPASEGLGATITALQNDKFATLNLGTLTASLDITINVTAVAATTTVLADGSQGIAGNGTITGLTVGNKYVVQSGADWYGVLTDGSLGTATTFDTAIGASVALDTGISAISGTGVTNGTTYNVFYLYSVTGTEVIDLTSTDFNNKNVILDIHTLTNQVVTLNGSTSSAGGPAAVYVYTNELNAAAISSPAPIGTQVLGNTSGYKYSLSDKANEGTGTITALSADKYGLLDLSGVNVNFTVKITAATQG
jgi:hypothetical protein